MTQLLKIKEAAKQLGVPSTGLQRAAETHGLLVVIGTAEHIEKDALKELVKLCRVDPKDPAVSNRQLVEFFSSEQSSRQNQGIGRDAS